MLTLLGVVGAWGEPAVRGDETVAQPGGARTHTGIITPAEGGSSRHLYSTTTNEHSPGASSLFTDADVEPGLLRPISSQPIAQQPPNPQPPAAPQPVKPPYPTTEALPELEPVPPIALTPLGQLTTSVAPPTGEMPHNYAADARRDPTVLIGDPAEPIRTSAPFYSTPRTPDFVNQPLYFEQRATERDGHSWGAAQPFVSGAQFFGTFAVLPYKMGAHPPFMRLNTGNGIVIPSDRYTMRQKIRGATAQTGAVLGMFFIIP